MGNTKHIVKICRDPDTVDALNAVSWLGGFETERWQRRVVVTFNEPQTYGADDQVRIFGKDSKLSVITVNDKDVLCTGAEDADLDEPQLICFVGNILKIERWVVKEGKKPSEDDIKTLAASAQMWYNLAQEYIKRGRDNDAVMCMQFADQRMDKAIELSDKLLDEED